MLFLKQDSLAQERIEDAGQFWGRSGIPSVSTSSSVWFILGLVESSRFNSSMLATAAPHVKAHRRSSSSLSRHQSAHLGM